MKKPSDVIIFKSLNNIYGDCLCLEEEGLKTEEKRKLL